MQRNLVVALFVAAVTTFVGPTAAISQLSEPAVVHLVLGGPGTSALYHRDTCPLVLNGGVTSSMGLDDAKKRYFRPHCACITGQEAEPPCTENTIQSALTALAINVSKYVGMATRDVTRLHGVPKSIIEDRWTYEKPGITLRVANNKVIEAWAGSRPTAAPVAAPTPTTSTPPPSSGPTAQCKDGTFSYSKSRSGTCSGHGGVARWIAG